MEHHHRRDSGSDTCLSSSDEAELLRRAGAPERLRRLEAFVRQPSASPEEGEERYSGAVVEDRNEGSGARARRDAAQAREREDIERLLAEWDGDFALHEIRCAYQEASRDVERARATELGSKGCLTMASMSCGRAKSSEPYHSQDSHRRMRRQ